MSFNTADYTIEFETGTRRKRSNSHIKLKFMLYTWNIFISLFGISFARIKMKHNILTIYIIFVNVGEFNAHEFVLVIWHQALTKNFQNKYDCIVLICIRIFALFFFFILVSLLV